MTLQQELTKISKGQFAPVYLLVGSEQYLADLFMTTLKQAVLTEVDDDMNFIRFDMEQLPLSLAIEEANTIPFFGDQRVVQLDNPYFLTGERHKVSIEHNTDLLLDYILTPMDSTILVVCATYDKLDSRKKIVKELKKQATVISVEPLKEQELRQYVRQSVEGRDYEITPEALDSLIYLCQMQLSRVMSELDKIMLFSLESKKITKPIVESLVAKSLEQNIFEMVDYVMKKQPEKSLRLHQELLLQGEDTIKISAILLQHIRLLIQVKIMLGMGYQKSNMADVLKVHPYRVQLAMQQVRAYDLKVLGQLYDTLAENDWLTKTGQMDKELLFELFILRYSAS
ncbi:DNA polymerase III subunit delta [Vagococcus xieshaowenii]|uniref:DNA polymerase III subunit delta n=1 Tax=Vagococcus xieshaowenii TaxID=2562451 RepID=A0A4Z0DAP6_9ENTE|nr:DNA polymerase III subunit delta [Vagococcus xieshaowenii]QCA29322.1 DNA polymerase III subunit delta [Vagococcus xieshaowenii]TFZ41983.1 DNA polymerase III subunit delta [Vagococcus xieshaowenii]